jgi:AbrB family looped-hinge helix DNA binding protein
MKLNSSSGQLMSLVAVKNKYQVVIPQKVREQIGLNVGDLLEAKVERGKITFTPKSLLDRGIAEALEDLRKGRVHGPYKTVAEALKAFKKRSPNRNQSV